MRKIVSLFILMVYFSISIHAEIPGFVEKVEYTIPQVQMEEEYVDISNLYCDSQPIYGNGIYLQVDWSEINVPHKYRWIGFSNSPMYVYDRDFNLIKSIEFDDYVGSMFFKDGYFYFLKEIVRKDGWSASAFEDNVVYKYYKGENFEKADEITAEEYSLAQNLKKLYGGMRYTFKDHYAYGEEGNEFYVDEKGAMYEIVRENSLDIKYSGVAKTSLKNGYVVYRQRNNNDKVYISLDAVSLVEVYMDAEIGEYVWTEVNDGKGYIHIGIENDKKHSYRVPVSQLTGFTKIKYNEKYLSFITPPVTENDRTLVPMRFLLEQMGATVDWNDEQQSITVKSGDDVIKFVVDENVAYVNGEAKTMDVPARLINDKTMIPLRFLAEEFGYKVEWDGETKTATIFK